MGYEEFEGVARAEVIRVLETCGVATSNKTPEDPISGVLALTLAKQLSDGASRIEVYYLERSVKKDMLHRLHRLYDVPLHFLFNPEMVPTKDGP